MTDATTHRRSRPMGAPFPEGSTEPNIHQAMAQAMALVSPVGKTGENKEQGYKFRSIDKFMDALNPAMAEAGVHVVPRVLTRLTDERTTRNGAHMRLVDLEVAFTFYGPAGDSVVAIAWGEGSDTGDKATNKAMTGAFKYAILQVFMVPTADIADADLTSPDVPTAEQSRAAEQAQADASPEVVADLRAEVLAVAERPKPDRAKLLADLWKRAQKARALGATVSVPEAWRAMVGEDDVLLHALITGVRETDQLPPHAGLAAGETADPTTGEVASPALEREARKQEAAEAEANGGRVRPRCPQRMQGDGVQCEKAEGHPGRHSYLPTSGSPAMATDEPPATDAGETP